MSHRIGFIGAGRMASAMVDGLLRQGEVSATAIACTCGNDDTGPQLAERTGIRFEADPLALMANSQTLVLACKPQQFDDLPKLTQASGQPGLILSIMAGIPLRRLVAQFPEARHWVRAMPNTPGQIGCGVTAYASHHPPDGETRTTVESILGSLGKVLALPEEQIDAVTAVSGSGPAYLFAFTEALRAGGLAVGLDATSADLLARETIIGAALLMRESGQDPAELRRAVTSPGGTTEAALASMQTSDFEGLIRRAVQAARDRSQELAGS